ncbi:hypothetical protein [Treponema sp. OMZ 857]|uniref:hypothetical protein n=1 Tax=Treponema sp. OMZ 857 TaxID=1643513 RepID=UPI0020A44EC1|nr:hypothetical protein [Treponema sp. OMZ 857]UTC43048.1 hypothetical protein E4N66_02385 [Treponema sp. OMZ 857]
MIQTDGCKINTVGAFRYHIPLEASPINKGEKNKDMKRNLLIGMILVETMILFLQGAQLRSYIGKWKIDRIFTVNEDYHIIGNLIKNEAYAYMGVIIVYAAI